MEDRLTLRAAYLYYRSELTQAQVAAKLGVSRVKVGRLLASAERRGIVHIDIRHPLSRLTDAEVALEQRFGLREAVVVASAAEHGDESELRTFAVASAGAFYLASLELTGGSIAVGWGTTMHAVSEVLADRWARDVQVFQLNGAIPVSGYANSAGEMMTRFAQRGHGRAHILQVPAIVDSAEVRVALETDRSVRAALEGAARAPIAMFSLGRLTRESVLVSSGYIQSSGIDALQAEGAMGDVISRFIGADGEVVDALLDARTMGVDLATLRERERSIGIAAGAAKASAARAAIAGGYVDTVIVDDSLADELLRG
ncbi:sugar-binding domain-containing protein [Agrococcus sp. ARC_14]|uniref:sugar-binding transcriptional regulator n=1 Tax=Agrococcus sp. ARC_14 TaxID=2919927 RepID=UPI001F056255|nr:sugar-binding domain-containing protein [Agrococcus sp. ARC_14]MCH1881411.1 sugar-binding transcriptional regulator [Agrococcus sp. ARC_14]